MTRTLLLCAAFLVAAPALAVDRKELKPGLVATFADAAGTAVTRLEPTVGLTLAAGETPHPKLADVARITWAGYIQIVTPGEYVFTGPGLTVKLNGTGVPLGTPVALTPGVQSFEATFAGSAPTRIELRWKGPGFKDEPLPYFFFGHRPQDRPAAYAADLQREHGRLLFEELACVKCHTPELAGYALRDGPNLSEIGKRVYPGWLDAWLADPAKLRPHTAMPKLFADDPKGRAERYAVVKYLTSLGGPLPESKNPSFSNDITRQIRSGEKLFVSTGCTNCHGTKPPAANKLTEDDDDKPAPQPPAADRFHAVGTAGPQAQYALGALGSKTSPSRLAEYLQDPLKTNPHGRMPRMQLTGDEARDLARFLCRTTDDGIDRMNPKGSTLLPADLAKGVIPDADRATFDKKKADDQWKDLGRRLVSARGCVNCHVIEPKAATATAPALAAVRKNPSAGCVAEKPDVSKVPVYALSAEQRSALTAFLSDAPGAGSKSPVHSARVALRRFQCLNCHLRDGEGGIGTELAEKLRGEEKGEAADNDPLPPRLTGVGHKATSAWMKDVILGGGRARPWMGLRMPQYGDANVGGLPTALAACDGTAPEADAKPKVSAAQIEAGRKLAGKEGLGCISCHDISGFSGGGTRGPDLALTDKRVKPDWYARWMHNPQRLAPGTRMPSNFVNGQSALPAVLNGDADAQIQALWAYFALGPGLPLPAGLEPPKGLVIPVKDRPEVLRTFLPDGAGAKALAVGYPGGGGLAFDAHAARLAYAWEGNFVDASPVWNNRGGAPAKLLGPKYYTAPPGHPWAVGSEPPDFGKRADDFAWGKAVPNDQIYSGRMNVRFLGYTLDPAGFPTFRYQVSEPNRPALTVADTPVPIRGAVASGLTRKFALTVEPADPAAAVWLLLGQSAKEPRLTGGRAVLSDGSRAMVFDVSAGSLQAVKAGSGWQAVLKLPAKASELTVTTWSLPRDDDELLKGLPAGK